MADGKQSLREILSSLVDDVRGLRCDQDQFQCKVETRLAKLESGNQIGTVSSLPKSSSKGLTVPPALAQDSVLQLVGVPSASLKAEYETVKDSVARNKLPSDLKFNDNCSRAQSKDRESVVPSAVQIGKV